MLIPWVPGRNLAELAAVQRASDKGLGENAGGVLQAPQVRV